MNPFIYFETKGQLFLRIFELRHRFSNLSIRIMLFKKQRGVCPICREPLSYLQNSSFEICYIKQRSLFSDITKADKIEDKQL